MIEETKLEAEIFEEIEAADNYEIVAPDDAIGERLDKFLADALPMLSRSRIKILVEKGLVFNGDNRQTNVSYKIKGGEVFHLNVPAPPPAEPEPENIPLNILFEDDHILVIDKPAGLSCHPAPGNWTGTLVNAILFHCGKELLQIGAMGRPGIVHRLDKGTSGVMVVCKSAFAMSSLGHQFQNRTIDRLYHAVVVGGPRNPWFRDGRVETRIARDSVDRKRMAVVKDDAVAGRNCATNYRTLEMFEDKKTKKIFASLIECKLETGRTHQVRVHMKHIGCALIGDLTYGDNNIGRALLRSLPEAAQIGRQALHAKTLAFTHPKTSERMNFESEYPADMIMLKDALKNLTQ